jgi:hypothetical protein
MLLGDIFTCKVITRIVPAVGNPANSVTVLHYRVSAVIGAGATDKAIAIALATLFAAPWKAAIPPIALYQGVILQKIDPLPVGTALGDPSGAGAGVTLGEVMPFQVCGLVTKRTLQAGRRFRGRCYIPWPTEVYNNSQQEPTAPYALLLGDIGGALVNPQVIGTPPNTSSVQPVLYHKGFLPRTTDVLSVINRVYWGIQRKRGNAQHADSPIIIPV